MTNLELIKARAMKRKVTCEELFKIVGEMSVSKQVVETLWLADSVIRLSEALRHECFCETHEGCEMLCDACKVLEAVAKDSK